MTGGETQQHAAFESLFEAKLHEMLTEFFLCFMSEGRAEAERRATLFIDETTWVEDLRG